MLASIIATATHPIMDWTNNYGVRPLLPWNSQWFYGDFVFIIDPFIWIVLGGAAFLLTSKTRKQIIAWAALALIPSYLVMVGPSGPTQLANETVIRLLWIAASDCSGYVLSQKVGHSLGHRVAIAALATVTIYFAGLAVAHSFALRQAQTVAADIANRKAEQVVKLAAMPTVANPTEWVCVMETNRATYRFSVSLLRTTAALSNVSRFEKPAGLAAKPSRKPARLSRAGVSRLREIPGGATWWVKTASRRLSYSLLTYVTLNQEGAEAHFLSTCPSIVRWTTRQRDERNGSDGDSEGAY